MRLLRIAFAVASAAGFVVTSAAFGGGFQVSESSVSALGLAFAGAGIGGDSPADLFHNPGGLMLREGRETVAGLHWIAPNAAFKKAVATDTDMDTDMNTETNTGRESNGGENAVVPNFYYAADAGARLRYGVGITSPFGLATDYSANWAGKYHAIKTELLTVEVNPVLGWRVNDWLSVGGGITLMKAEAEISSLAPPPLPPDTLAEVEGDDTAVGYNFGIVAGDENARIGFGYRSKTELGIKGNATFTHATHGVIAKTGAKADLTLPATVYLSGVKKINEKFNLLATIRWTDWSQYKELHVELDSGDGNPIPQNWRDSYTYSIGVRYLPAERWILRAGYSLDETPLKDKYRTARIPDTDRQWLALGASFQATKKTRIDIAFAHLFTEDASVCQDITAAAGNDPGGEIVPCGTVMSDDKSLIGTFDNTEANILAIQLHFTL